MKKAIKQKLLNLVTFNPIDYCIKANVTNRHIDILKYVKKSDFENFINGDTSQLEISAASGIALFEDELKSAKSVSEFINIIENNGFIITESRRHDLESNFELNKKKAITYFVEQMKSFKKQFISLNRIANNYFNDTTVWPLYLAYRFIKGKLPNNIGIKAPLIIFKVTIVEEGSKLYLKKLSDDLVVNEKLQVVMNKEYPLTTTSFEELLNNISFDDYINRFEKMIGYSIKISENQFENFKNEDHKTICEKYNKFEIENSALVGIFEPGGGALKEDLKKIIELDQDPFENQIDSDFKSNSFFEEKIIKDPSIVFEIGKPLNIYQKYAVASALSQSTLIYGPPGTGKSEVISNIIANALIKGKSTLMVSEKKAALDVLTERMNSLSQFALYLFETSNKDEFYKKIDNLNSLLGTQWYREGTNRGSRATSIEPIKFNKDELMFIKNYEDWYQEVLYLLKKHWAIEDFNDGIYKMDYIDYQNLKNELGEQICSEWLQQINIDGYGTTTLLEAFKKIYNVNSFSSINAFFEEYLKYKKFLKKYNLLENNSPEELNKYLKHIINKINSNTNLVEKFLLGGNKLRTIFEQYFSFIEEFKNNKDLTIFMEKSYKEKKTFFALINDYLDFRNNVLNKTIELRELTIEQLLNNINICEDFISKYKKQLATDDWLSFLSKNSNKLARFIDAYNNCSQSADAEVMYAEFIINSNIISNIEDSSLNIKQIKYVCKDASEIIQMIKDYLANISILNSDYIEQLIRFKDLFKYDVQFLEKLRNIEVVFGHSYQEIIKEWNWISLPFIKYLYLNPIYVFDLDKVAPVMQLITSPINDDQFKKLKIIAMWNEIIKENPMFFELKGIHLQDIIMQMRKESIRATSIVEELIFKKYINNLRTYLTKLPKDDKDEIANVLRLASSNTKPPIVQFVKKYYKSLKQLFPIWVARPDNVADMIPLIEDEFYYGIFDEASQISIERAYPLVYRCFIKVVSGDDKQLKPTSFFMNKLQSQDFEIDDFDAVESLLERAKVSWWNEYHLKNHYRSESKELIEFSNKFIYKNSLEIATKAGISESGIVVYNVNNAVWDQVNKQEADKVIEILLNEYEKYKKILIITFNSKQSQLIENLIFEKRSKLPINLIEKLDNNDIVITNLENVQGNEGDLVILSVSYGKNPEGIIRSNFGPLILNGGSNRLNVAITRARQKMIVVKSLYGDQIRVNPQNENAVIFKKFIEYIDAINEKGSIDNVNEKLTNGEIEEMEDEARLNKTFEHQQLNTNDNNDLLFSTPIVKEIYSELVKVLNDRYKVINDFKVGSKNIDLLILDKQTNIPIKAILVENWKNNRTIKEMIEDIDRQYFLEDRGYSTFRIKEFEWCIDKVKLISKIKDSVINKNTKTIDYVLWQIDK